MWPELIGTLVGLTVEWEMMTLAWALIQARNFFLSLGMTLKMITVNYPLQKNISETSTIVLMSFSVIRQSLMILDLWSRYQIEWIIFRYLINVLLPSDSISERPRSYCKGLLTRLSDEFGSGGGLSPAVWGSACPKWVGAGMAVGPEAVLSSASPPLPTVTSTCPLVPRNPLPGHSLVSQITVVICRVWTIKKSQGNTKKLVDFTF